MNKILIGGSRVGAPLPVVRSFVAQVLKSGFQLHVGCAVGADQAVIEACLVLGAASALSVFAVGAPGGAGFWSGSACSAVRQASARGVSVQWLAGGELEIPLVARLAMRSRRAMAGCSAAVFFCAPGGSKGSLTAASVAVAQGLNVFMVCSGGQFPPELPGLAGAGVWVPAPLFGIPFWQWVASQIPTLF